MDHPVRVRKKTVCTMCASCTPAKATEYKYGDLVMAKLNGRPAWPAKISYWNKSPDRTKYLVQFFGTDEIAFVAPDNIQPFTSEVKSKLSTRRKGETAVFFAEAVKKICQAFEELQQKRSSSMRADNKTDCGPEGPSREKKNDAKFSSLEDITVAVELPQLGVDSNGRPAKRKRTSDVDEKAGDAIPERSTSQGPTENCMPAPAEVGEFSSNASDNEDGLIPRRHHHKAVKVIGSSSTRTSFDKTGKGSITLKNYLPSSANFKYLVSQLPAKRRAVRLLDDNNFERPKTPVHGGSIRKGCVSNYVRSTSAHTEPLPSSSDYMKRPKKALPTNVFRSPQKMKPGKISSEEAGLHPVSPTRSFSSLALVQSAQSRLQVGANKESVVVSVELDHFFDEGTDEMSTPILKLEAQYTPQSSRMNDIVSVAEKPVEISSLIGESLEKGKEAAREGNMRALLESNVEDSATSMKNLLAVAHDRRRGAQSQSLPQENSAHLSTGGSLSTEAAVARDAFRGMIETLTRTKESIGRATRLAFDCAKNGIASEVMELVICKLETEPRLHRRVDLLFLVDSITQRSHRQKGIAGACYIPIVQAVLPRLLGAAAPSGAGARENRKQCLKVLRLWIERKILPESDLQHYVDAIGLSNDDKHAGSFIRYSSLAERAIDGPARDIDGLLVDEYGSNATIQLPGHLSSHMFEEIEEDNKKEDIPKSSCKDDDRLPKEPNCAIGEAEIFVINTNEKHCCILEDVDGELEMEDVSVHLKDERAYSIGVPIEISMKGQGLDRICQEAEDSFTKLSSLRHYTPPSPPDSPPPAPPLPSSPMPPLPPILSMSPPPHPPPLPSHAYPHFPPPAGMPLSVGPRAYPFPSSFPSFPNYPYPPPNGYSQSTMQRVPVPLPPFSTPTNQFSYLNTTPKPPALDIRPSGPRPPLERPLANSFAFRPPGVTILPSGPPSPLQRPPAHYPDFQPAAVNILPSGPPIPGLRGQPMMPYGQGPSFDGFWRPA